MRCNIKVAYRDRVIHPERRSVTWDGKDSDFCREWGNEWLTQFDRVLNAMEREQSTLITPRMERSVKRAMRFHDWAWVRLECRDAKDTAGTAYLSLDVRVNDVNHVDADSGVMGAAQDCARFLTEIAVHLREDVARKHPDSEARKRVRWDSSNEFFARAEESEAAYWRRKRVETLRASDAKLCPSLLDDGTCKAGVKCKCVKCKGGVCVDAEVAEAAGESEDHNGK